MDSNTSAGMKRPTNCDLDQPSSSKLLQIASTSSTSITIGAIINAEGHSKVTINNLNVHHQQPTPDLAPCDIEFQVADPVDTFRGREGTFQKVKQAFDQQKGKHQYNLVAVCGYGGMGKTQFARMYIKRNREELQNVVWIFSESETKINESFKQLRNQLADKGYRCYSDQDVYKHLNSESTIFVFDNSENIRSVQQFLPGNQNSSLFLVTSKSQDWDTFTTIELQLLDLKDAEKIMKAVLVEKQKIAISDSQLKELVKKFEFETIPLLLQIKAGYICRQVRMFNKRGKRYNIEDIVKELNIQQDLVTKKFHNFILDPYDKSIYAAIYQTLEQIRNEDEEESKLADKMLGIAAYLNPEEILEDVFKCLLQIENEYVFNESLDILFQFSLFQLSNYGIGIHRIVQQCVQYHHRDILKSNEYYRLTLPVLINNNIIYLLHYETIFQYGEKDFETLCTFYKNIEMNQCNKFHKILVENAPFKILKLLLNKFELLRNPNFLCEAIHNCDRDNIIQILHDCGANFNITDDQGYNAVFNFVLLKDDVSFDTFSKWKTIKALTESGVDVNSQYFEGNTIIHNLCIPREKSTELDNRIFEKCALMIHLGANPRIKNNSGQTPIDLAEQNNLTLTFQLLNAAISGYKYILHIAAKNKQYFCLRKLIEHKICNIDDVDDTGCTVFHILAGLPQQDKEDEEILLEKTADLLKDIPCNVSIINNAKETSSDIALQHNRNKLADMLNAWIEPGRGIYENAALRSKIEHFSFVRTKEISQVNEQDNTGCTLLHTLCSLDTNRDSELNLVIVKFAAYLTMSCNAYVNIRNKKEETAGEVARRCGHHLLADFLVLVNAGGLVKDLLISVALKHKQFNLVKYAWWRYVNVPLSGLHLLHFMLFSIDSILSALQEDSSVTDAELINFIDYLKIGEMAEYYKANTSIVETARKYGREELANYMQTRA